MKFVLICHSEEVLTYQAMSRWIHTFAELSGIIAIEEPRSRMKKRIKMEIKRSGILGFIDVIAFRLVYKFFGEKKDKQYEINKLKQIESRYPAIASDIPVLKVSSPNTEEVINFLEKVKPDFAIARCKTILKEAVFTIPSKGTFVMHPGICPEYRNAHGCFWAINQFDYQNVGMTLLRVDPGIDTGPVYGYYTYDFDVNQETHNIIQSEVVLRNLDSLETKFKQIYEGNANIISITGRKSGIWGQPWLSKYLLWKIKKSLRGDK